MMRKLRLIRQYDDKDCGAACLAMILQHYGKKVPMAQLRRDIDIDAYGASIYGMLDGAEKHGLQATALHGTAKDVWMALQDNSVTTPVILRVVNQKGLEHYVVAECVRREKLHLLDPDLGRGRMDYAVFETCFLGEVLLFEKGECFRQENLNKGRYAPFLRMVFGQKKLLLVISLLSLLTTGIGLAGTYLFQYLLDHVLTNTDGTVTMAARLQSLIRLLGGLGGLYLFKVLMEVGRGKAMMIMRKNIDLPLILGVHWRMTELPMNFFDTRKTGEILSRFEDASKIRDAVSGAVLTVMVDLIMAVLTGTVLWRTSAKLFQVALIIIFISLGIGLLYMKPIERLGRNLMGKNEQFDSYLKETVDGMETIKVSHAEDTVRRKTKDLFHSLTTEGIQGNMVALQKDALVSGVSSIGMLVLLWYGVSEITQGKMTVGVLITFVSMLDYFLTPIQNLLGLQDDIQTAKIAADRLYDLLDHPAESSGKHTPDDDLKTISFEDVSFRYGSRRLVLDRLTMEGKNGQCIALVGESGCGKSTVTRLLQGLYQKEAGKLTINDTPIEEIDLSWLRAQIACVPQETFLFADTIRNNLLLGWPEDQRPEDAKLWRVLEACCCDFVRDMPMGLDSVLEEGGTGLSGGQRQRLAIARALLRKPRLLILDEATSALDTVTERRIRQMLQETGEDRLVLIIAHRLSTVREADHIYVLENGHVAESGRHEQLLAAQGLYAHLWTAQNDVE